MQPGSTPACPHLAALKAALANPLIIDGRNLYDPHQLTAAGLTYLAVGRNNLALLDAARQKSEEADIEVAAALLAHASAAANDTPGSTQREQARGEASLVN